MPSESSTQLRSLTPIFVALALSTNACGGKIIAASATMDDGVESAPDDSGVCAIVDAGVLDPDVVQQGSDLVTALKCRSCHTGALSGNIVGVKYAPDEGGLAYPPNLTPDPATGLGCWTNDQIVEAMQRGVDNQGEYICPPMPRFATADGGISDQQARAIATYLQSLIPTSNPNVPNTYCAIPGDDPGMTADATLGDATTAAH